MNKTFFGILLAVCMLGMALALFSERLSREPESAKSPQIAAAESQLPSLAASNSPENTPETIVKEAPLEQIQPPQASLPAIAAEKEEANAARAALAPPAPIASPPIERKPDIPLPTQNESAAERPLPPFTKPEAAPEKAPIEEAKPGQKPAAPTVKTEEKPLQTPPKSEIKPVPTPKSATSAKGGIINNFVVYAREKGATIRMGGNSKIKYTSMTLENPNRVVVDLDGAWRFPDKLPIPKNDMVNGIRVGKNGDKTRIVIDLKAKPRISRMVENQNGNSVDVRVDK